MVDWNAVSGVVDLYLLAKDVFSSTSARHKQEEWEKLTKGYWYNKGMRGYVGAANHEARDVFESWFEEAQKLVGFAQPKKRRQSGSAKGSIWMSPDVDLPLEDFREYMS